MKPSDSDTGVLKSKAQWDEYWTGVPLPTRAPMHMYPLQRFADFVQRFLPAGPDLKFIEVGCGAGQWMVYFHETFGYQVFGSDYSELGCELGRRNLAIQGIPGEIILDDLFDSRLPEGSFDVVLSMGLVEHFSDPSLPLARMSRLLTPDGFMVTLIPNYAGVYRYPELLLDREHLEEHNPLRVEELGAAHSAVGLDVVAGEYKGGFASHSVNLKKLYARLGRWQWPLRKAQGLINHSVWPLLRLAGGRLESRLFSPYVVVIARRPAPR